MCEDQKISGKVGDTLTAIVTGAAAASYEWAVSVDGEDWTVVETETDETFAVTADLLGMYVKVTVTAEDGETASDVTLSAVAEADGQIEITSATATKANEIEVTLAESIDPEDTVVTLAKGTSEVTATVAWDDVYKVATITTAAKLSNGTYTVTVASETDEDNTDSEEVVIEDQYVAEIVITTEEALTDPADKGIAYSSYEVYDQYGQSLRASTSITWAGSCTIRGDKTTGKLTLTKTGGNDWIYGEQIYVTGVYSKTGASVNATLKVGTEQALDSLEIAGFVKQGQSTIVQTLPKDFKDGTYYLLFKPVDKNGTQLDVDDLQGNDVTFVSDNVLVIKEVSTAIVEKTVAGETYAAALVSPGIRVSDGGEVTVTAIANRTGNKTEISMKVGEDQVLASFKLLAPTVTVADGDTDVEIPFEALDVNGDEITDFVTLAKQETFNTLSFTASDNSLLKLQEQADGSAKLLWSDAAAPGWGDTRTTDGIDRPISLTAVVVGGGTDNEMIYVSDKRRPNAIIGVDMDTVYTEGATITFTADDGKDTTAKKDRYESFQFEDQYNTVIKGTKGTAKKFGDGTGFFAAANAGTLNSSDIEINGYTYGVRVQNAGSGKILYSASAGATVYPDGLANQMAVIAGLGDVTFETDTTVTSAETGEGFKFTIVKSDAPAVTLAGEWDTVTPAKYVGVTVVDLSQVKSFAIADLNKFYIGKTNTYTADGKIVKAALNNLKDETQAQTIAVADLDGKGLTGATAYQQEVVVKGTYNGESVTVPAKYYTVIGDKISTAAASADSKRGINKITAIRTDSTSLLSAKDLYDAKTSEGLSKDAEDTLKATLYNIYSDSAKVGAGITVSHPKSTALATVTGWADTATAGAVTALFETGFASTAATTYQELKEAIDAANAEIWTLEASIPDVVVTNRAAILGAFDAEVTANNAKMPALANLNVGLYDTVSKKVTISDQDPVETTIDGLKDSYTIAPTNTRMANVTITDKLATTGGNITVKVKDQYGVANANFVIAYKISDLVENPDAYAANNFAVDNNDSATAHVSQGAERGDAFKLTLTSGNATAATTITVGADTNANIQNAANNYHNLVNNFLEPQRLAGLG